MADLNGACAYFSKTLRNEKWNAHLPNKRELAISEAEMIISRLPFSSKPPAPVLNSAIYEQAYCLLESPQESAERINDIMSGLKSMTVGKQSESYQDIDKMQTMVNGTVLCPNAYSWIAPFVTKASAVKTGRITCRRR